MNINVAYRPETPTEMIGNTTVVKTVTKWLDKPEKMPQTIVLIGEPGCGKTTMGRILGNGLVGKHYKNFIEENSADKNSVDDMRELTSAMKNLPISGSRKVILLDECHKLSGAAMNQLLKGSEEPPAHVTLILATSEPKKLLKALDRRGASLIFKGLKLKETTKLVGKVCDKLGYDIPDVAVIEELHDLSQGKPGHVLKYMHNVVPFDSKDEQLEALKGADINDEEPDFKDFITALLGKGSVKKALKAKKALKTSNDPESLRRKVLAYCDNVASNPSSSAKGTAAYDVMVSFSEPVYDTGWAGITMAIYEVLNG